MNLTGIKLGKGKSLKKLESEKKRVLSEISQILIVEIENLSDLPSRYYVAWTGEKIESFKGFRSKFGVWPRKAYHFTDGLGSHHWRFVLPKKGEKPG